MKLLNRLTPGHHDESSTWQLMGVGMLLVVVGRLMGWDQETTLSLLAPLGVGGAYMVSRDLGKGRTEVRVEADEVLAGVLPHPPANQKKQKSKK